MNESYTLKKEGEYLTTEIPVGSGRIFGFKKWTWGEKNAVIKQCTNTDVLTGLVSFDDIKFDLTMILKTAFTKNSEEKFVPVFNSVEEINNMDAQYVERLLRLTQQLNLVSIGETKNL